MILSQKQQICLVTLSKIFYSAQFLSSFTKQTLCSPPLGVVGITGVQTSIHPAEGLRNHGLRAVRGTAPVQHMFGNLQQPCLHTMRAQLLHAMHQTFLEDQRDARVSHV